MFDYIEMFYNPTRKHTNNGMLSPVDYETAQKKMNEAGVEETRGNSNCYDNTKVATFFETIKVELIWRQSWTTPRAAELSFFNYINGAYNARRKLAALGLKSPLAFEREVA